MSAQDTTPDQTRRVLLVQTGTPTHPTPSAVRAYLARFLADPHIVSLPRIFWLPLLYGVILPIRSPLSAKRYRRLWTDAGSPLEVHTKKLVHALQEALGPPYEVDFAYRYSSPTIHEQLKAFAEKGDADVLVVPLFPQDAGATTGSIRAAVIAATNAIPQSPPTTVLTSAPTQPEYIRALSERVTEQGPEWDHHLFSFHGIPEAQVRAGDHYPEECLATATALAQELNLEPDQWTMTYQSRFGPAAWLQPYTIDTLLLHSTQGKRCLISFPGFTMDCLETLDEIGNELKETCAKAGGTPFGMTPCLNDHPTWVSSLSEQVRAAFAGNND